jgi:hypothetical protein
MSEEELKPCPICNTEDIKISPSGNSYILNCLGCGLVLWEEDEESLREDWNTRPLEDALRDKIDRLKEENKNLMKLSDPFLPHGNSQDCPTWYDGCNCSVGTLEYNIKMHESYKSLASELAGAIKEVLESEHQQDHCPFCDAEDYPVDKNGNEVESAYQAEEYHRDHHTECLITKVETALAKYHELTKEEKK